MSAGLLGLGFAAAGFLAYNKVDDLKDWVSDQWTDGFGLVADPELMQEQVSSYVEPGHRTPKQFAGMSVHSIYDLHYNMRDDLCQYFSRMWCEFEGREWNGENHSVFLEYVWSTSWLGSGQPISPTYRFERAEVIQVADSVNTNEISEYTYQMIIRETDSRNTQARVTSGLLGAVSTGIGAVFSEATHAALRSSGFMRGNDGWNGQNWEDAPGANRDPLLMYAWARTDFKTGKWWSTVDSQGDVAFWIAVSAGGMGASNAIVTTKPNPDNFSAWSYEQIIYFAHEEMTNAEFGPFLQFLSTHGQMPFVATSPEVLPPASDPTPEEIEQSIQDQVEASNDSGRDDYMPGEEPPEDDPEDQYGPPRS